jgi:hypothetical protein
MQNALVMAATCAVHPFPTLFNKIISSSSHVPANPGLNTLMVLFMTILVLAVTGFVPMQSLHLLL